MIYNLLSLENNERVFIKIRLDSKKPEMESLIPVWKSADWYEREAYDMMGINFLNHPDLRECICLMSLNIIRSEKISL
ncbi:MAG: NADH-quinone oxidoreductase subunit C [Ignavibacteria bacterium]